LHQALVLGTGDLSELALGWTTYGVGDQMSHCHHAWGDQKRGDWPDLLPPEKRDEYDLPDIKKWLEVFFYRFFKISQFKRSAMPNGPKVGSGGSLSPGATGTLHSLRHWRPDFTGPTDTTSAR